MTASFLPWPLFRDRRGSLEVRRKAELEASAGALQAYGRKVGHGIIYATHSQNAGEPTAFPLVPTRMPCGIAAIPGAFRSASATGRRLPPALIDARKRPLRG